MCHFTTVFLNLLGEFLAVFNLRAIFPKIGYITVWVGNHSKPNFYSR
jgi:hypothetical protein